MEWVRAREAEQISGRNRKNIYQWARKGHIRSKTVKINPWQKVGTQLFHKGDVERVSELMRHGARLDLKPLDIYEPDESHSPYTFTERQLEIARKALQ